MSSFLENAVKKFKCKNFSYSMSFFSGNFPLLTKLFAIYIRLFLKYASTICFLQRYAHYINLIENAQMHCTFRLFRRLDHMQSFSALDCKSLSCIASTVISLWCVTILVKNELPFSNYSVISHK